MLYVISGVNSEYPWGRHTKKETGFMPVFFCASFPQGDPRQILGFDKIAGTILPGAKWDVRSTPVRVSIRMIRISDFGRASARPAGVRPMDGPKQSPRIGTGCTRGNPLGDAKTTKPHPFGWGFFVFTFQGFELIQSGSTNLQESKLGRAKCAP